MVLNNSKHNSNDMVVNTELLKGNDLKQFINLNEELEQRRAQRLSLGDGALSDSSLIKATRTREEIFESSSVEGDLTACEQKDSYIDQEVEIRGLDKLLRYFDENVPITPTIPKRTGKVASAIASFKSIMKENKYPSVAPKKSLNQKRTKNILILPESTIKVMELKKKYESHSQTSTLENKSKHESLQTNNQLFSMKVKEMAQLFNSKINEAGRCVDNCERPNKEYSLDKKLTQQDVSESVKPIPKPRTQLPTYRFPLPSPLPTPGPSPCKNQKQQLTKETSLKPIIQDAKHQQQINCLIAEDVFRELSVKDKILLFNKFIKDMSDKNPKFNEHAEIIKKSVQKNMASGEVIIEKQATVKSLAKMLEAKCVLNSPQMHSVHKKRKAPQPPAEKCKVVENLPEQMEEENEQLHLSSLTVVLKPSPNTKRLPNSTISHPRKNKPHYLNYREGSNSSLLKKNNKRSNSSIRSSNMSTEPYEPPRKIRHTRTERPETSPFFQYEDMETLFYSWIKEKNGVLFDIINTFNAEEIINIATGKSSNESLNAMSEIMKKTAIDQLLEKTIAKLEECKEMELSSNEGQVSNILEVAKTVPETLKSNEPDKCLEKQTLVEMTPSMEVILPSKPVNDSPVETSNITSKLKVKRQAPPVPVLIPVPASRSSPTTSSCISSTNSSAKQSDTECESGLSALPKNTSGESQLESLNDKVTAESPEKIVDIAVPSRLSRKKKIRRSLTWKDENYINEHVVSPITTTDTTDSDSDAKQVAQAEAPIKYKTFTLAKKFIQMNRSIWAQNKLLFRKVNSPRKVKSSYTLTTLSSPVSSIQSESELTQYKSIQKTRKFSRSWPSALNVTENFSMPDSNKFSKIPKTKIVQGFKTATNKIDSPKLYRVQRSEAIHQDSKLHISPLCAKFTKPGTENSRNLSENKENPSVFSTPIKGHMQQTFTNSNCTLNLISPISQPIKQRHLSIYEPEALRSSMVMQVIREDHPLDLDYMQNSPFSSVSNVSNESVLNNPTTKDIPSIIKDYPAMTSNSPKIINNKIDSMYWITACDFTVSFDVCHNSTEDLRVFYESLVKKSSETNELSFGIDGRKFTMSNSRVMEDIKNRTSNSKCVSHYWFSSGDLVVQFFGKYMPTDRIHHIFKFIRESLNGDISKLHFGVDHINFSSVSESWTNTPKFSKETDYNRIAGLQKGNNNVLEGQSKSASPNVMTTSVNSNGSKTSDLGTSYFESESIVNSSSGGLSVSPLGNEKFEKEKAQGNTNSNNTISKPEMHNVNCQHEPINKNFNDFTNMNETQESKQPLMSINEMIESLQRQKLKLQHVAECLRDHENATRHINTLEELKNSPKHVHQLHNVNAGKGINFYSFSQEQLENFLYLSCHYGNVFFDTWIEQIDQILNVLMERRNMAGSNKECQMPQQ